MTLCALALLALLAQPSDPVPVFVFQPAAPLEHVAPLAGRLRGEVLSPGGIAELTPHSLLVAPNVSQFPADELQPLNDYLDRGGHLLAFGGSPFENLLYQSPDGEWLTPEALLASVPAEHPLLPAEALDPSSLGRGASQPDAPARYEPLPGGIRAQVELRNPIGWETVELPIAAPPPADHDVLWFSARGGGKAETLLIELRERDGARWMALAPLSADTRNVGLHRDVFRFWADSWSQGRGGESDRVRFDNLSHVVVGFASSHQPLPEGVFTYEISGLATGRLGRPFPTPQRLRLEGMSPAYKGYYAKPARYAAAPDFEDIAVPAEIWTPIARPWRRSDRRGYTWQPLVKGLNQAGEWIATPISITWSATGASWACVGFTPSAGDMARIVERMATMAARPPELPEGPPPLLPGGEKGPCIEARNGHFWLDGKRWFANGVNYWPSYTAGLEPREYFEHWLMPWNYIPELIDQDLALLERLGVNLVSIQYGQTEQAAPLRDFISRCGQHGVKVNIYVNGAHPTAPRADDDLTQRPFIELMRAADLRGNPHVFAYDLAWEPHLGAEQARQRYDALWEAWLEEQYESVARAESVWGVPVNRVAGRVSGPTDEQVMNDGPHRVMVAAYRRFCDDLISRRYREVIRIARELDGTHLFGARTGYGGTGTWNVARVMPYQLTSGAAHLDFLSPEGYGYGPENISDAAFISRYARWAGHGKPVFWSEFGMSVWQGGEPALIRQGKLYEAFMEMITKTNADGWACWWFPGGYRVDEKSDFGIVSPDAAPRPAALVLQRMASSVSGLTEGAPGATLTVDRDEAPAGVAALVRKHSAAFREDYEAGRMPNIQTAATDTTSLTCPYTGVGAVPYETPGPPAHLNAEIAVESQEADQWRVQLINTGEAAWDAQDCELTIEPGGIRAPLPQNVRRFERVTITLNAKPGARLRMTSKRFAPFGEPATLSD